MERRKGGDVYESKRDDDHSSRERVLIYILVKAEHLVSGFMTTQRDRQPRQLLTCLKCGDPGALALAGAPRASPAVFHMLGNHGAELGRLVILGRSDDLAGLAHFWRAVGNGRADVRPPGICEKT
jgi:hypothetical protein